MLQILDKTPFQSALAIFTDQNGAEKVTIAIKGTFEISMRHHGEMQLASEQLPVQYVDEHYGEPGNSSIKYPADLVLGKVATDIGLIGIAQSPRKKPVKKLLVSVKVGPLQKKIMVIGDRFWKKRSLLSGFYMTDPKPFTDMPLIYERAFGGIDQTLDKKKYGGDNRNPVGTGFRLNKSTVDNHKLPNLEHPDHLISHWKDKPPIACYGFTEGSWEPRSKFVGTYNDTWLKNQAPLLPKDFDLRFFNSASSGLIAKGLLKGGEHVQLLHLSKQENVEFNLPKLEINLMFRLGTERNYEKADLWTVMFEPNKSRFYMVWGGSFCVGNQPSRMKYVEVE
ncbi:MAG: DUF2169 family type VI secretion system accessory protein, partial [Desulfobacterales bacterium]